MHYKESDGLKYLMEKRWDNASTQFPQNKGNFIDSFHYIENYMNEHYHKNVNIGAVVSDGNLLTDHGIEHIQMVIRNSYSILGERGTEKLNGYEIYILLLAIHFHDVGNIMGREDHEKKIDEIIEQLGEKIPLDVPEKIMVSEIAISHGGFVFSNPSDKDTIRLLKSEDSCNGIIIRPALLASILRLADELADDNTRANRYLDEQNLIPSSNAIFHEYSFCLSPLAFKGNVIEFTLFIPQEKSKSKIPDENGCYLYDEIIKRLRKCLAELEYCKKYSDGMITITKLKIAINVMRLDLKHKKLKTIEFDLRLSGYPQADDTQFKSLEYPTGDELRRAIECEEVLTDGKPVCCS